MDRAGVTECRENVTKVEKRKVNRFNIHSNFSTMEDDNKLAVIVLGLKLKNNLIEQKVLNYRGYT